MTRQITCSGIWLWLWFGREESLGCLKTPPSRPTDVQLARIEREWRFDDHTDAQSAPPGVEIVRSPPRWVFHDPVADLKP
jgi:hypothetical protein